MTIFNKRFRIFLHFSLQIVLGQAFFLFFFSSRLFSQGWCGTVTTPQQVAFELEQMALQQGMKTFSSVPCLNKKLSIVAYLVKDSTGNAGITEAAIQSAMTSVNKIFEPLCLKFEICEFVYVDNFKYDKYDMPVDEDEMVTLHYKPKVINMYFVQDVPNDPECGHAYFPGGKDLVVIKKPCMTPVVLAHELGHFFGLYHTFETAFGVEPASQNNCQTAGDLLCDTEADPQGSVDAFCNYTGPYQDSSNDYYIPPVDNIMSSYGTCPCRFTSEQFMRMANQYLTLRSYLW